MRLYYACILILVCRLACGQQQGIDTLIVLKEVSVSAERVQTLTSGLQIKKFDSLLLSRSAGVDAGTLLQSNSMVSVKSYGPGSLGTASFRGTLSNHNAVYWNGMNINPANIGVADFSLIPVFLFDDIHLQYGGASSLFGSGNIGGALHLNNHPEFGEKKGTFKIGGSSGSFHTSDLFMKAKVVNGSFSSLTGVVFSEHENDYPYINTALYDKPKEYRRNAAFGQKGFLQQLDIQLVKGMRFGVALWYEQAERQIPPSLTMLKSEAVQNDAILRGIAKFRKTAKKYGWELRIGHFSDHTLYEDNQSMLFNTLKIKTSQIEGDFKYRITKKLTIISGAQAVKHHAVIDAYAGNKNEHHGGCFIAVKGLLPVILWTATLSMRQEFYQGFQSPFTPMFGAEGKIAGRLKGKINVSRNFRAPTLNDRFWVPGGNTALKPENSWNGECTILSEFKKWRFSLTAFTAEIDNLIMWLPTGYGYWSPKNAKKVWSRGIETDMKISTHFGKLKLTGMVNYAFTKVTNEEPVSAYDESYKKMLQYIPMRKGVARVDIIYKKWSWFCLQNYSGLRFTKPDNSEGVPAFFLTNTGLEYKKGFGKILLTGRFEVKNLLDEEYQMVPWYPMPGRSFKISVFMELNI